MRRSRCVQLFPVEESHILGDGGCITTIKIDYADRLRMLRNHGRQGKYDHEFTGYDVVLNEINAAIGRVMLKHLDGFNEIAARSPRATTNGSLASCKRRPCANGRRRCIICMSCAPSDAMTCKNFSKRKRRDRRALSEAGPLATGSRRFVSVYSEIAADRESGERNFVAADPRRNGLGRGG